jgi:hypothetical protein
MENVDGILGLARKPSKAFPAPLIIEQLKEKVVDCAQLNIIGNDRRESFLILHGR